MTTPNSSASKEVVTAALLVIGGKILSGRTKDQNIGYIAEYLTALGIDLNEVRVVGDEERAIVDALNALRHRCTLFSPSEGEVQLFDCARRTRSSMSSTARLACASFCASRARSTGFAHKAPPRESFLCK